MLLWRDPNLFNNASEQSQFFGPSDRSGCPGSGLVRGHGAARTGHSPAPAGAERPVTFTPAPSRGLTGVTRLAVSCCVWEIQLLQRAPWDFPRLKDAFTAGSGPYRRKASPRANRIVARPRRQGLAPPTNLGHTLAHKPPAHGGFLRVSAGAGLAEREGFEPSKGF